MNILFVHEIDAKAKVVFDIHLLSEAMAQRHYGVFVVDYPTQRGYQREEFASRALPNSNVCLIHPPAIQINGLRRASAFISHYFELEQVINRYSIEAIILYAVPTNGLQTLYLGVKHDIPVIFRSIDILHKLVPYPILRGLTYHMEEVVYEHADRILTITPKLSDYVVKMGAYSNRVSVLNMPVDTNIFRPIGENSTLSAKQNVDNLRQKWGIEKDDKVVLFMGTLFPFSGLDAFIPHFQKVVRKIPNAKLLIVGDGEQRYALQRTIDLNGLSNNVKITGFQPYQEMPYYINLADVCINTFIPNEITNDIFPGKTVQFLACGKPLVMRPLAGVRAVIEGEEQGVSYCDDDYNITMEVISLLSDDERRNKLGMCGYEYANKNHSCAKVAEQLDEIIQGMCKK